MHRERAIIATLEQIVRGPPPASGAVVMATGIVSIALSLDGQHALSYVLLAAAAAAWIMLCLVLAGRIVRERERVCNEACSPAALTGAASTAVLGARLAMVGWSRVAIVLLGIAAAVWLLLLVPVLRHWVTPTSGVSFLLTVSTESLAVLCATLAGREHATWLLYVALVLLAVGVAFYVFAISSFDPHQIALGHGDHWITGGALAVAALAGGRVTLAAHSLDALHGISASLKDIALALWLLAIAWLPVLLAAEALRPRLRYDIRRWSTVFPFGMYAACSFTIGAVSGTRAITDFARLWTWIGLGAVLITFIAMIRRGLQFARRRRPLKPNAC
jgi:tellurite resistance protein TehA-like permease